MSWYAVGWARAQQCGSPALKVTLMVLAEFANDKNLAWPSQKTLATATEQSVDTVARQLKKLTESGFIEKAGEKKRPDGGRSVVVWRILFDAERFEREQQANRSARKGNAANSGIGNTEDCGEVYRTQDGNKPAECGDKNLVIEPIEEPHPLTPEGELGEGLSIDLGEIPSKTAGARFDRFRDAWPSDPTINWERVESGFYRMPADDQENAAKIASRYVEYCRREGRKLKAPQNWLRDKGWAGFLEEERKASAAVERGRTMVWIMEGTRAWDAWRSWYEAKSKVPKVAMQVKAEKGLGNYFPTLFPPGASE